MPSRLLYYSKPLKQVLLISTNKCYKSEMGAGNEGFHMIVINSHRLLQSSHLQQDAQVPIHSWCKSNIVKYLMMLKMNLAQSKIGGIYKCLCSKLLSYEHQKSINIGLKGQ